MTHDYRRYGTTTLFAAVNTLTGRVAHHRKAATGRLLFSRLGHHKFLPRGGHWAQVRGSAANSAVCYSLGITAIDPVAMGLLFERFLSEERGEWPDIDLPSGPKREKSFNTFTGVMASAAPP